MPWQGRACNTPQPGCCKTQTPRALTVLAGEHQAWPAGVCKQGMAGEHNDGWLRCREAGRRQHQAGRADGGEVGHLGRRRRGCRLGGGRQRQAAQQVPARRCHQLLRVELCQQRAGAGRHTHAAPLQCLGRQAVQQRRGVAATAACRAAIPLVGQDAVQLLAAGMLQALAGAILGSTAATAAADATARQGSCPCPCVSPCLLLRALHPQVHREEGAARPASRPSQHRGAQTKSESQCSGQRALDGTCIITWSPKEVHAPHCVWATLALRFTTESARPAASGSPPATQPPRRHPPHKALHLRLAEGRDAGLHHLGQLAVHIRRQLRWVAAENLHSTGGHARGRWWVCWQLRTQHLHSLHTLAICCSAPHPAIPCTLSANADTASDLLTQAPPTRSAAKQPHPPTLKLSRSILSREVYCSARAAASPVCLPPCCAACCASCHAGGAGIPAACAACSAAATAVPASPGSPGKRGMSAAEALELAVAVLLLPPAAPASASAGWTE